MCPLMCSCLRNIFSRPIYRDLIDIPIVKYESQHITYTPLRSVSVMCAISRFKVRCAKREIAATLGILLRIKGCKASFALAELAQYKVINNIN